MVVTHPIRLGLAINYFVFQYDVLSRPEGASKMSRSAVDGAIVESNNAVDYFYEDSTLIMQILMNTLTPWTSDAEGDTAP